MAGRMHSRQEFGTIAMVVKVTALGRQAHMSLTRVLRGLSARVLRLGKGDIPELAEANNKHQAALSHMPFLCTSQAFEPLSLTSQCVS